MSLVPLGHVEVDERGVARVAGSRTKVAQIVLDGKAHGWSPEEIQSQYSHLSLADIHAAMVFYYDHQAEIDAQIEHDNRDYEKLRASAGESAAVLRLRAEGGLRKITSCDVSRVMRVLFRHDRGLPLVVLHISDRQPQSGERV